MKLSTIFRLARKQMETDPKTSPYICDNIMEVAPFLEGALAKRIINNRIGHEFSILDWLAANRHITKEELEDLLLAQDDREGELYRKLQNYRLAWLAELEREFAAKGE